MAEIIEAVKNKDTAKLRELFAPLCASGGTETYSCPICRDAGLVFVSKEENITAPCRCQAVKRAKQQMAQSGLLGLLDRCGFDSFLAEEPWQKGLLDLSQAYLNHVRGGGKGWMYLGGQPGCGKTHLCTAVCAGLLDDGVPVKYMLWTDQIQRIKADINDSEALDTLLTPLQTVPVLYVDDLFKGPPGPAPSPTAADLRLAFEIFNTRYVRQLTTLLSSEWDLMQLLQTDQGTFSRVYQLSKGFTAFVQPDYSKNYRLRED